jgi:hypothetical protein
MALSITRKTKWSEYVDVVGFIDRSTFHRGLGKRPFEAVTGAEIRMAVDALFQEEPTELKRLTSGIKQFRREITEKL